VRAERLRPVMTELANLSTRAAADALNRRGIKTASGGQWFPMQVHRARHRLDLWASAADLERRGYRNRSDKRDTAAAVIFGAQDQSGFTHSHRVTAPEAICNSSIDFSCTSHRDYDRAKNQAAPSCLRWVKICTSTPK